MKRRKIRIIVDCDGTLSGFFDNENYLEMMFRQGYFKGLRPYANIIKALKALADVPGVELYVLSSTNTEFEREEKREWLKKHLGRTIRKDRIIFSGSGQSKAAVAGKILGGLSDAILIDDYNVNLEDWRNAGGKAVKFVNEINDRGLIGPLWEGCRVFYYNNPEEIVSRVLSIASHSAHGIGRANGLEDLYQLGIGVGI